MTVTFSLRILATAAALALALAVLALPVEWAAAQSESCGESEHPSGNDRCEERGGSGEQGKAQSDPDDDTRGPERTNGGADQPGGPGGENQQDQDGNNGCGNDQDFEDDNEGLCGGGERSGDNANGGNNAGGNGPGTSDDDDDDDDDGNNAGGNGPGTSDDDDDGAGTIITGDDPARGQGGGNGDGQQTATDGTTADGDEVAGVTGTDAAVDGGGGDSDSGHGQVPPAADDAAVVGFGSHGLMAGPGAPDLDGGIAMGAAQELAQQGTDAGVDAGAGGDEQPQLPATGTAALTQLLVGLGSLTVGGFALRRGRTERTAPWLCDEAAED